MKNHKVHSMDITLGTPRTRVIDCNQIKRNHISKVDLLLFTIFRTFHVPYLNLRF